MKKLEKVTMNEIEELCRKAREHQVEITITARPEDGYELDITPWHPTVSYTRTNIRPKE